MELSPNGRRAVLIHIRLTLILRIMSEDAVHQFRQGCESWGIVAQQFPLGADHIQGIEWTLDH
jgi:hypothetical protein